MADVCGRAPVATLAMTESELDGPGLGAAVSAFARRLGSRTPTALDALIPAPRLREVHGVDLDIGPEEAWTRVRHGDLARARSIRALFALRTLPERVAGRGRQPAGIRVDDLVSTAERPGFQVLAETAPCEVAVGAIGKVWRLEIPFVHVADAGAYAAFARPGFVKVTWALRVLPRDGARARVEVEVRVDATDRESWARFRRYFRLIGPFSRWIRRTMLAGLGTPPADGWRDVLEGLGGAAVMALNLLTPPLRTARSRWGVDAGTAARAHPGDDLVPDPSWSWTHGVEIAAPAEAVWGWIAQIGADRGGFYSYQWLENLIGCQVRNADRVHPEWELGPGQALSLHPKAKMAVVRAEKGRYLVAHGRDDHTSASWLLEIEPLGARRCRLISRFRTSHAADLPTRLRMGSALVEPIGFALDRRMLLGVKQRAERARA
jgi:hypothetical protein